MAVRKLDGAVVDARLGVTMKSDPTRIDPRKLKLGKSVARHDPRTLLLASYVTRTLPAPPASFDVTSKVKAWGMMDNDQIGDCTCAAAGHLLMEWTANSGKKMFTPTYKQNLAPHSATTGHNGAAGGRLLMEWTANSGKKMFPPTYKQIVAAYSAITGYNPVTGANDNGANEGDVLNYWRQTGIAGHKIGAYVALEPANHSHVMDSVYIFEG